MPFRTVADPQELAILRAAFADLCIELNIAADDEPAKTELATDILWYFQSGVTNLEELKLKFCRNPQKEERFHSK